MGHPELVGGLEEDGRAVLDTLSCRDETTPRMGHPELLRLADKIIGYGIQVGKRDSRRFSAVF